MPAICELTAVPGIDLEIAAIAFETDQMEVIQHQHIAVLACL
jgi:hypothetical protein